MPALCLPIPNESPSTGYFTCRALPEPELNTSKHIALWGNATGLASTRQRPDTFFTQRPERRTA